MVVRILRHDLVKRLEAQLVQTKNQFVFLVHFFQKIKKESPVYEILGQKIINVPMESQRNLICL
jgi:hypothetical protein